MILSVGCGGNQEYPHPTLRDVNLDVRLPSVHVKNFFLADVMHMPFKDKVFDSVFASHIIEHMSDPGAFISECSRVGQSVELRFPHWAFAGAYFDPSHKWVWFNGKFCHIPHFLHLIVHFIFTNRLVNELFKHTSSVNQEKVRVIGNNSEPIKRRLRPNKFMIDTFAYMSFWSGFSYIINVMIIGISFDKYFMSSIIGFVLSIFLAGFYGRYLDFCRKKLLNNSSQTVQHKKA